MEKGNGKERSKWIAPKLKLKKKKRDVVPVGDLEQGFVIIRVFQPRPQGACPQSQGKAPWGRG